MTTEKFKTKGMIGGEHLAELLEKSLATLGVAPTPEQAARLATIRGNPDAIHEVEVAFSPDEVRLLVADPDVDSELRADAEAFLASVEA